MNAKIGMALIFAVAFILGIAAASYAVTSGPGGRAKIKAGDFSFEIQINDVDLQALLKNRSDSSALKEEVKKTFKLYDIDGQLITAIAQLDYRSPFSEDLRNLRDRFVGPFNAPDMDVDVRFSDTMDEDKAQVCPSSVFYQERINIALTDFSNMYPIDEANVAIVHGCPTPEGTPEPIIISTELGKKLLNQESLPESIRAVAKVLPSYVIVK